MRLLGKVYLFFLLFCYIFSFTVLGPINSSMLAGILSFLPYMYSIKYRLELTQILSLLYVKRILACFYILVLLSIFFPVVHLSFDYYYFSIFLVLFVQFVLGISLFSYIQFKVKALNLDFHIKRVIVYAFALQSFIQCLVSFVPSLQPIIFYFNGAQSLNESYSQLFASGVRGVALAAGTGFSLSLGYGLSYIIYVDEFFDKLSVRNVFLGILLVIGTFFAGRTGFVGFFLAFLYYLFGKNHSRSLLKKSLGIVKILFCISLFCVLIYMFFPSFAKHMLENVFPFAFEPLYKLFDTNSFETDSTNDLMEMWKQPVSIKEFLVGAGYYFDPIYQNSYYKGVDIGIFKNLYFWGIVGYFAVIVFQYYQLYPLRWKKNPSTIFFLYLFAFLFLMDFKAIALGLNKMAFTLILLIVLFYEQDSSHNSIRSN